MHDIVILVGGLLANGADQTFGSAFGINADEGKLLSLMESLRLALPVA